MSLTIASTTSSEAELRHAVSEEWRDPSKLEEVKQESAALPAEEAETAAEPDKAEKPEKRSESRSQRYKRKISSLEEENGTLRSRLAALESGPAKTEPVEFPPEPRRQDFQSDEDYAKAYGQWQGVKEGAETEALERQANKAAYQSRLQEFVKEAPDFDAVTKSFAQVELWQVVQDAIEEMTNGPSVFYHICKNPEIIEEMMEIGPKKAIHRVYGISEELEDEFEDQQKKTQTDSAKDEVASHPTKQRVTPPPPVRAVGGASARSSIPLDQLSGIEYVRVMNRREREKGRR